MKIKDIKDLLIWQIKLTKAVLSVTPKKEYIIALSRYEEELKALGR